MKYLEGDIRIYPPVYLDSRGSFKFICYLLYNLCQVIVSISDIHPKDTEVPSNGIDDMTRLSYLHEPGVLNNLAIRYTKNIIYVSICSLNLYVSILFTQSYYHFKMIKAK
jgi:hypothetical protein